MTATVEVSLLEQHPLSAWHGISQERRVCASVRPSVAHPEHYDLLVVAAEYDAHIETKRPVKSAFIEPFLDGMLEEFRLAANDMDWRIESERERFWRLNGFGVSEPRVYFIGADTFVKIGWAAGDPRRRLGELQTGCPFELTLLAAVPGDQAIERRLHDVFRAYAVRGEWFRHEGALAKYIKGLR